MFYRVRPACLRQLNFYRSIHSTRLRLAENVPTTNTLNSSLNVTEHTSQLYLDNMFPLRMSSWDIRQLLFRNSSEFLKKKVNHVIPSKDLPHDFTVRQVIARTKDGGAIIRFSFKSTTEGKAEATQEILERIQKHIQKLKPVVPFNLQQLEAFLVKGKPFLEDLMARYPTQRLRIEFQGDPVCIETLYGHLRPYGKIFDISLYPNPNIGKDPARYAIVQFKRVRSATSARNCLHGYVIDNTRLNLLYERQMHTNVVKDWLVSHPRITIPVLAAVLAGVTYAVFDPVRTFFITSKVTQRFNPEEYALYRWLRKETWARLVSVKDRQPLPHGSVWAEDSEQTERVKSWLAESPETFILVSGHKGSGKSALVKTAIEDKKHKIYIDCGKIANARTKSDMTKNLAKEVGYFPLFTWIASTSGLVDTMITATTGQKTNFSTSTESQVKNILETVAIALRDIVPVESDESDPERWIERLRSVISEKKEPKKQVKKKDDHLDQKNIPVVVIDNFMYRETSKNAFFWDELAEWAALLIENGIAHVVFVSSNASVMKSLGKALPGKTFTSITLSDSPQDKAMNFVTKQLGEAANDPDLAQVVSALGGRFTELELLVQKIKMNMDAKSALEDIIFRNLTEIRKCGFGDISIKDNKPEWTPIQYWVILKLLNENSSINYGELKWSRMFNGNEGPIKAMERAELITVVYKDGRANSIKPGKPIHYAVFDRIMKDTVFTSSMEIEVNMFLKKQEEEKIAKLEDTIERLSNVSQPNRPPKEIEGRIRYLLTRLTSIQQLIEQHDAEIKKAKEIVTKDWVENT